jgi:hypothetical protein
LAAARLSCVLCLQINNLSISKAHHDMYRVMQVSVLWGRLHFLNNYESSTRASSGYSPRLSRQPLAGISLYTTGLHWSVHMQLRRKSFVFLMIRTSQSIQMEPAIVAPLWAKTCHQHARPQPVLNPESALHLHRRSPQSALSLPGITEAQTRRS